MSRSVCAVFGCHNTYQNTKGKVHFHKFPSSKQPERRALWARFAKRINRDGSKWEPTKNSLMCSEHFIGGRRSLLRNSPAYNPTLRPGQTASRRALKQLHEFNNPKQAAPAVPQMKVVKAELKSHQIDLDDVFDLNSCPAKGVATQCNFSGTSFLFQKCTGKLNEFSSTHSVKLFSSKADVKPTIPKLIFSVATQVSHDEEIVQNKPNYKDIVVEAESSKVMLKTYSRKQQQPSLFMISSEKSFFPCLPPLSVPLNAEQPIQAATQPSIDQHQIGWQPHFAKACKPRVFYPKQMVVPQQQKQGQIITNDEQSLAVQSILLNSSNFNSQTSFSNQAAAHTAPVLLQQQSSSYFRPVSDKWVTTGKPILAANATVSSINNNGNGDIKRLNYSVKKVVVRQIFEGYQGGNT